MQGNRLWTLVVSGILAWLFALLLGGYAPLLAGLAAGRFAPRKGSFWWGGLGALLAWLLWFIVSAASVPIVPLAHLLGQVVGIGAAAGVALPLLAAIFAGLIAGVACSAGQALFTAAHREEESNAPSVAP